MVRPGLGVIFFSCLLDKSVVTDIFPLSCAQSFVVLAIGLSCLPGLVYCARKAFPIVMQHDATLSRAPKTCCARQSVYVVCTPYLVATRLRAPLSRHRMLCCDMETPYPRIFYRDVIVLCRDIKTLSKAKLYRDVETPGLNQTLSRQLQIVSEPTHM